MTTFTLLHGAFEGAWIFGPLADSLRERGHDAVAVDLPIDDVTAGWPEHAEAVLADTRARGSVLVAHSRAGRVVPELLTRGQWDSVILLAAAVVGGRARPPYRTPPHPTPAGTPPPRVADEHGRTVPTEDLVRTVFAECSVEQRRWIAQRLRPQHELPAPADVPWPDVQVSYVIGAEDTMVDHKWVQRVCRDRLAIEPTIIPGGHSPFLTHPAELARTLSCLVSSRTVGGKP